MAPIPIPYPAQEHPGLDYECELVVVISRSGIDIPVSHALDHVLGYAVGNDISHREWQTKLGGGQWALGKGFDGWAPWGPGIVTKEVVTDPQTLRISTKVNGETLQDCTTEDMVFSVKEAVSFLSRGTTLSAGDVIFTGTPHGVGMGRKPQRWLRDGDIVETSLEGVGTCRNRVEYVKKGSNLRL